MPELKDVKKRCHFCKNARYKYFQFDLQWNTINHTIRHIPVCSTHFNELCDTVYTYHNYSHLPMGQREYVAIKHLESKLDVNNTIQFNN